jgi:ribonuclease R
MAQASEHRDLINEVILRTQAQAIYSPENIGHFGLNLASYAHFTSPIRRYADVIVHRALIKALKLGEDGLREGEEARLDETAEHISMCERRSMAAEREATERYIAAFLAEKVGAEFTGKVSGITRFGLFVKLDETQADGLVPISSLGPERWAHEEAQHALVGQSSGRRFHLGQRVEVRLAEAAPVSGGLVFEMLTEPLAPAAGWKRSSQPAMRFRPAPPRGGARPPKTKGRKRK